MVVKPRIMKSFIITEFVVLFVLVSKCDNECSSVRKIPEVSYHCGVKIVNEEVTDDVYIL